MSDKNLSRLQFPTAQDFIPTMKYRASYAASLLRGEQDTRPWDLQAEISRAAGRNSVMLDVGCGAAIKLVGLAAEFSHVFAVEPSQDMRVEAKQNFALHGVRNGAVLDGEWRNLPIPSRSVDLVTSMLAGFFIEEIVRVLKPGGKFIVETIGPRDQVTLKTNFGSDDLGPRGQYLQFNESDFLHFLEEHFRPHFTDVQVKNGFWDTYYTFDGLQLLLSATPIVRNFDPCRDKAALLRTAQQNMTRRGIKTAQNRVLVTCTGKR